MENWQFLLAVGLILLITDLFVVTFYLFPIGLGLILGALASVWITDLTILVYVTSAFVATMFGISRFVFLKYLSKDKDHEAKTAMDGYVGKAVTVVKEIRHNKDGEVKIYGETWKASSADNQTFAIDESAYVQKIEGNRMLISKQAMTSKTPSK